MEKLDKKPPFINARTFSNLTGIATRRKPTLIRIRDLSDNQMREVEQMTGETASVMVSSVSRYYIKIENDHAVGWIKINRPDRRLEGFGGTITQAVAQKLFEREV
jgi:hypothetical protein